RPCSKEIGRPLEAVIADAERCERGNPRSPAQDAMTRFTAFLPALLLVLLGGSVALTNALSTQGGASRQCEANRPHDGPQRGSGSAVFRSAGNGRNWSSRRP